MAITDDNLKLHRAYETYRKRIVEEDTLINHRMSWMIFSESIMFVLFGAAERAKEHAVIPFLHIPPSPLFMIAISTFGLLIAVISLRSIGAAQEEIYELCREYDNKQPDAHDSKLLPKLTGQDRNHYAGHLLPNVLPTLIIAIWLVALLYAISLFWTG
jgi:hypothetical protein